VKEWTVNDMRLGDLDVLNDVIERTDWYRLSETGTMVRGAVSGDNAWYREGDIFKALDEAPTIDAVPVVRCGECKHRDPENHHCDHIAGTMIYFPRKDDDFCSYGERRGDG
jgi:hypothetical protein